MISQRVTRILAAAIDGELTPRQRRAVDQLLNENAEARALYDRMTQDSKRLKALSKQSLPGHFSSQVLQSVGTRPTRLPKLAGQAAQKYLPIWAIIAAAAAVMLAISLGTYLIAVSAGQQKANQQAQERNEVKPPTPIPSPSAPTPVQVAKVSKTKGSEVESLPPPRDALLAVEPLPELPETVEPKSDRVLTIPFNPKIELFTVGMPKLPPILAVRELDHLKKSVLVDSMNGQDELHLDLFAKDANKSFDMIKRVLGAQGKRVLVEALAHQRSQLKLKTNYVVYSEALTVDDVMKLLSGLAAEETKAEARKETHLEKMVAMPLSPTSQKTMALLLGVDPKLFMHKTKPAAGVDIQKPISNNTASSLAKALAEKEKARSATPVLIAMSFNPVRPNPAFSKEVREFLAARKDRKPGTLPVMIVLRNLD